jgi:hypothetical protein
MTWQRRHFFLTVVVATGAAMPAFGQTAGPTGLAGAARSAASIPDFSGLWAHPGLGFDSPLSGPGPVRNKSRRRNGVSNADQLVGDDTNPILKPEAAEVVKKHGAIELSGMAHPTPSSHCWPSGGTLHFFSTCHADVTAAGQDYFPLPPGS